MFKRIVLTAVLGAGLVVSVGLAAEADHKGGRDRDRRDWGIRLPGPWGYHTGLYSNGAPASPHWHYRGFDKHPDVYWYPNGYGAGAPYLQPGYYPGAGLLGDVFGDDYYFAYGYRCNGYRDGYYYGPDGDRLSFSGRPFYRRNADCESFFRRHGYWFGYSDCSRFEVEKGYCDDYDRHGHRKF